MPTPLLLTQHATLAYLLPVTLSGLLQMAPHRACLLRILESQKMWTCQDPGPFHSALSRVATALVLERPPPCDSVHNDELGSIDEGLRCEVTSTSVISCMLEQM